MPNLVSQDLIARKGTDRLFYQLGCWCWSSIYIPYGVCHASFCLFLDRPYCINL